MFFFFFVVVLLSLLVSITLGLGLAIGFTLTCIFTSIDLGSATICGLLAIGITLWSVFQTMKAFDDTRKALEEEEAIDDEFQSEVLTESQVDSMTEQLTEAILMRVTVPHARTRRNSGRIR